MKSNINIENARLVFKNFAGEETKFNRAGDRNFCVFIDDAEMAQALIEDGWNIRILQPRDEGDEARYYIKVSVSYKAAPPKIIMITGKKKTSLNEETIESLDYAEIKIADLIIRPYEWEVNGKSGTKAYLKTLYVTIEEDEFANKYADLESPEE